MSPSVSLALLFVLVIVGLAGGLYLSLWVLSLGDNVVAKHAGGVGTLAVTFGCVVACVGLLYLGWHQLDRMMRRRKKAIRTERKAAQRERTTRKHRKKRQK